MSVNASQFKFLSPAHKPAAIAAASAEAAVHADPRTACFQSRRCLELMVGWIFDTDPDFKRPYERSLASLLAAPCFKQHVPAAIVAKAQVIRDLGNAAVHSRPVKPGDALTAVRELFHVAYWFARTYDRDFRHEGATFDPAKLPSPQPAAKGPTAADLKKLQDELHNRDEQLAKEREERLAESEALAAELETLKREVAEAKQRAAATPDPHDYSEAQTRDLFIDLMLREAGWGIDGWKDGHDIECPVKGMPNNKGDGFVDYVLWGDDGLPLALVEAKRTKKDARIGQQQAKLYADCLEAKHGRRPIVFYTNGYETWLWDDEHYPPRNVQGFYTKDELELLIERRTSRLPLDEAKIDRAIVERPYQIESIRELAEDFTEKRRKGLIVMATGAGKTRTVIALVDLLQRCGWVKRALFLADRTALVKQAIGAFKKHLPQSSPVNLVTDKLSVGRVYVSTYPTMLNLIEESRGVGGEERRFGPGHFDLVIIDEAHRSVYQKYRAIFEYFDSLLVGLTATPRAEVDRDTYGLFDLQQGLPTFAYELDEAVSDGWLVPPKAVSVPLKFQREGIRYDDLSDDDKERWDALEWTEDGDVPDSVEAAAVNEWLFNTDTVDKVLAHLMENGVKVAGGDRLGKTIVFAKNRHHARFIEDRFNKHYPHLKGSFARVIDHYEPYAQSLLDDFSIKEKDPHIAISVDMLDTGVDVPEVVNLVFFKLVRSKTKFFQMLGRGTRLCKDLFGPGQNKEFFYVFDYCQNLEFFNQNPSGVDGNLQKSLSALIFTHRLDLHECLTHQGFTTQDDGLGTLRSDISAALHAEVAAMNTANFLVRPKRRLVEKFAGRDAWEELGPEDYAALAREVAGLPTELPREDEEAKRFDLLLLRIQLAVLRHERSFERLRDQVREIAARLTEKKDVPMVAQQMALIIEIQSDEWWSNVTLPMLENVRRKLRDLIKFIDKAQRKIVYTDFEDELGSPLEVGISGLATAVNIAEYRRKVTQFLREQGNHIAIRKVRMNEPLTPSDLKELDRLLFETSNLGDREAFVSAFGEQPALGLFIRSLVGLDREAAKREFADYLADSRFNANQIRFVNNIIDHLTRNGVMEPGMLYEPPYNDADPSGLDGVFGESDAIKLVEILKRINSNAGVKEA